jgi:uncharacterized protein with PIN domain
MPLSECELWANKSWVLIGIEQGNAMAGRRMRCPECNGRVMPHQEGKNGEKAHFEHEKRHTGCSLGDCFDSKQPRSRHPSAIS